MRTNTLVTLGASAAFGIMAIVLARGWINDAIESEFRHKGAQAVQSVQPPAIDTVPILVADAAYGFGDELTPQGLRLVDFPQDAVPDGAFSSFDELFTQPNQRTIVLARMAFNEPVLDFRISGPGARGSLSALISEGMRATAIRVNDVAGVAGFVLPGDFVDIIFTRDEESRRAGDAMLSDVILQNVRVLGIDQNLNNQASNPDVVKAVTVEVSNADAQRLHLAMEVGRLSLTLRKAGEQTVGPNQTLSPQSIATGKAPAPKRIVRRKSAPKTAPAMAAPTPSQTAEITIIRGETRDSVSVAKDILPAASPQPATAAKRATPSPQTLAGGAP